MPNPPALHAAMSTSLDLDSIQITPRTPRTARDMGARMNASLDEEVEMSLLDERERAVDGFGDSGVEKGHKHFSSEDKRAMALLCILCM